MVAVMMFPPAPRMFVIHTDADVNLLEVSNPGWYVRITLTRRHVVYDGPFSSQARALRRMQEWRSK